MGAWPFLISLFITAAALFAVALPAGAAIAFFLPVGPARAARVFVEWATALSGAGYIAVAIAWQQVSAADPSTGVVSPILFGSATALAYLPLCILLVLRALEPQWPVVVAERALGLSAWQAAVATARATAEELGTALALYAGRLFSDGAILAVILWNSQTLVVSLPLMAVAALLMTQRLIRLAQTTGSPAYPPLFGPLPELPPRLRMALRVSPVGRLTLQLSLTVLALVIGMELSGLGTLRVWAAAGMMQQSARHYHNAVTALSVALQSIMPLVAITGVIVWIWLVKRQRQWRHQVWVMLAAVSPIALAYPAVYHLQGDWYVWLAFAVGGLAIYITLQLNAGRTVQAVAARHSLVPGDNTPIAAVRALGLLPNTPAYLWQCVCEALSAAAAWFSSAALLAVVSGIDAAYPAAYALIWGILAGLLQFIAMWLRSSLPHPLVSASPLSATLEALSHDSA